MSRKTRRQAAAAVTQLLSRVQFDDKTNLAEFMERLARWRQRRITLVPFSTLLQQTPPFTGVYFKTANFDCVIYDDNAAQVTQRHTVYHEIGHILLDHLSDGTLSELQLRMMSSMLPNLDPEYIRATIKPGLCRSACADLTDHEADQEDAAEEFATQLALHLTPSELIHQAPPAEPYDLEVIARFASTLGPMQRPMP